MININGYLYIFYGNRGACAITNGTTTEEAFVIPEYMSKYSETSGVSIIVGGCALWKNKLIFSAYYNAGSNGLAGVYSWDLSSHKLVLENTILADFVGGGSNQGVYAIISDGTSYIYSATYDPDSTKYYVEYVSALGGGYSYDGYDAPTGKYSEAYFESGLYIIGSVLNPHTFQSLFISLAKHLGNASIRISYRYDLSDSWTTLTTVSSSTHSSTSTEIEVPAGVISGAKLQLKVEMKVGTGSTTAFPKLIYLKLK